MNLDNTQQIQHNDTKGVLKATEMLADQCRQAWEETAKISLPSEYQDITNVVVAGMGGSHLGAELINAVYRTTLKQPLIVQSQYTCPGYVGPHTLVIATSFSGNTEEVLSFVQEAHSKQAKIVCICSGGQLAETAKQKNLPFYSFESTYNPSRIPRYASGYLFIAQMSFLSKTGIINISNENIDQITSVIKSSQEHFALTCQTSDNPAKQLATSLHNKSIMLIASEHLTGSAYICKNQINESAKNTAALHEIPEMNHHLLEGLGHPQSNQDQLAFVFFESDLYHPRNQKRYGITEDIIKQQGISTQTFKPISSTPLTQAFETLSFTSYAALYLSILNQVDPGPNPWVDQLKAKMKQ